MKNKQAVLADLAILKSALSRIPVAWDGRECIKEMKSRNYHWRQMEWIGFYGQMIAEDRLRGAMSIPGARYENVIFDVGGNINWDIKVCTTKTSSSILNDKEATNRSIDENGFHGLVMVVVEAEFDESGRFKEWHDSLKGERSEYEEKRIERGAPSRKRKVRAIVKEIDFVVLTKESKIHLAGAQKNWENSDGSPRKEKYKLSKKKLPLVTFDRINF